MAHVLNGQTIPNDWELAAFALTNLKDQQGVLGSEVAQHALPVLWLAANVKTQEITEQVHKWVRTVAWHTQPPHTSALVRFVTELRSTIFREIPRGERIAQLARLDAVAARTAAAQQPPTHTVLRHWGDRTGCCYWSTDALLVALLLVRTLRAPDPIEVRRFCRRPTASVLCTDDWLLLVPKLPREPPAWGPLEHWRKALARPRGTLAQYATMMRDDWAEVWTRAGWRAGRALARHAAAWKPRAITPAEARALLLWACKL